MGTRGPSPYREAMGGCGCRRGARWPALAGTFLAVFFVLFGVPARGASPADPSEVTRFEAASDGATVELIWRADPGLPVGFNVLRALKADGPYLPINAWLIGALPEGAYRFVDPVVEPGSTYYYKLQVVDPDGVSRTLGPLTIPVMPEEVRVLQSRGPGASQGGHPAVGSPLSGASMPGGGCAAGPSGCLRDAAGLPLLLGAVLLWRARRRRRA